VITFKAEGTGSAEATIEAVARVTGVSADVLRGRCRTRRVARARSLVCYVAYMFERCTLAEIAAALGGRDHTTVMFMRDKVAGERSPDSDLRAVLAILATPVRGAGASGEGSLDA
jgi:chromosomal replication initiator protein